MDTFSIQSCDSCIPEREFRPDSGGPGVLLESGVSHGNQNVNTQTDPLLRNTQATGSTGLKLSTYSPCSTGLKLSTSSLPIIHLSIVCTHTCKCRYINILYYCMTIPFFRNK